jgi:hypothetical protein
MEQFFKKRARVQNIGINKENKSAPHLFEQQKSSCIDVIITLKYPQLPPQYTTILAFHGQRHGSFVLLLQSLLLYHNL